MAVISQKPLPNSGSQQFTPTLSSKTVKVLALTFLCLTHFEFNFVSYIGQCEVNVRNLYLFGSLIFQQHHLVFKVDILHYFIKFIPEYFILFDAIINKILS